MADSLVLMAIDRINEAVLKDNGLQFNQSQCKYLLTELLQTKSLLSREVEAIDTYMKECTPALKNLYCAAKEAEHLVVQCCSDEWVVAAVHYADCEQRFVEILLDVQRYTVAVAIAIRQGKNGEGSQDVFEELHWFAVGKYETAVSKLSIVMKERKHQDDEVLLAKLKLVELEYLGGRSREESGGFLVTYLIRRLGSKGQSGFANTLSRFSWNMTEGIKLQGHLGQGSYGVVVQIDWLGLQCAMKILQDNPYSNYFMKQVTFLAQLRHPNVVQLYCVGDEKHKLFIIIELMECDLSSLIHRKRALSPPFPLHVALDIMLQVAKGMRYLHSNLVTHRDLKSSNVLVRKSSIRELQEDGYLRVKICDFELAKVHPTNPTFQKQTGNVGTTRWMAPELQNNDYRVKLHFPLKADVYSFAILCYEILSGQLPFKEMRLILLREFVLSGGRPTIPTSCPPALRDYIQQCWDTDPQERPSFVSICSELQMMKDVLSKDVILKNIVHPVEEAPSLPRSESGVSTVGGDISEPPSDDSESNESQAEPTGCSFRCPCGGTCVAVMVKLLRRLPWISFTKGLDVDARSGSEYLQLALSVMQSVEKKVDLGKAELQQNSRQCSYLAKKISETRIQLETKRAQLVFHHQQCRPALRELYWVVQEGETLIEKCFNKEWLITAIGLVDAAECFVRVLLSLQWYEDMVWIALKQSAGDEYVQSDVKLRMEAAIRKLQSATSVTDHDWQGLRSGDLKDLRKKIESLSPASFGNVRPMEEHICYLLQRLTATIDSTDCRALKHWHKPYLRTLLKPELEKYLAQGSHGAVYHGSWLGIQCAVKAYRSDFPFLTEEIAVWAGLHHPHIVQLMIWFYKKRRTSQIARKTFHVVMELMDTNLWKLIVLKRQKFLKDTPFPWPVAIDIMHQIAEAMRYLHSKHIAHGDLKSLNVLVKASTNPESFSQGYQHVKLADFDRAKKILESSTSSTGIGTPKWTAPELFPRQQQQASFRNEIFEGKGSCPWKADVYSFGITCVEILTGEEPFKEVTNPEPYKDILAIHSKGGPMLPASCPEPLASFIARCWHMDPLERPSFSEICITLKRLKDKTLSVVDKI